MSEVPTRYKKRGGGGKSTFNLFSTNPAKKNRTPKESEDKIGYNVKRMGKIGKQRNRNGGAGRQKSHWREKKIRKISFGGGINSQARTDLKSGSQRGFRLIRREYWGNAYGRRRSFHKRGGENLTKRT